MNIVTTYLESGKLEALCLGLLNEEETTEILMASADHPAISKRIVEIENALQEACYMQPGQNTKTKMMQSLNDISAETLTNLQQLPLINRHSDLTEWNNLVKDLQPLLNEGDLQLHPIKTTALVEMYVAWVNNSLEEEGHDPDDFEESFLILEGSCKCNVDGKLFYLQAGDFFTVPPKKRHSITSTSSGTGYVKAILQRRKIA